MQRQHSLSHPELAVDSMFRVPGIEDENVNRWMKDTEQNYPSYTEPLQAIKKTSWNGILRDKSLF